MRWASLCLVLFLSAALAHADNPGLPGESNIIAARFPDNPSTVVVDVVQVGGTQLANNVSATRVQIDSVNSDAWYYDLSTATGYAPDCTPRVYIVRFVPAGADCQASGTPNSCVEQILNTGGLFCRSNPREQVSNEFASSLVPAQGISQTVRDFFNRQSASDPLKWQKFLVDNALNFASPDFTLWLVYFYSESGGRPHIRCVVPTESDPSVSLPSTTGCSGT